MDNNFYTQKKYTVKNGISSSKEDYLEMIYRLCLINGFARVRDVAESLNVSASSVSKTASALKEEGLINFEKYGFITLTQKGTLRGQYLLRRHNILNQFFSFVNQTADELALTEQIEHYFDEKTVENLEKILLKLIEFY